MCNGKGWLVSSSTSASRGAQSTRLATAERRRRSRASLSSAAAAAGAPDAKAGWQVQAARRRRRCSQRCPPPAPAAARRACRCCFPPALPRSALAVRIGGQTPAERERRRGGRWRRWRAAGAALASPPRPRETLLEGRPGSAPAPRAQKRCLGRYKGWESDLERLLPLLPRPQPGRGSEGQSTAREQPGTPC